MSGLVRFLSGSAPGFSAQCGTLLSVGLPHDAAIRPQLVKLKQLADARPSLHTLRAQFVKIVARDPALGEVAARCYARVMQRVASVSKFSEFCEEMLLSPALPGDSAVRPQLVALQERARGPRVDVLHARIMEIAGCYPTFAELIARLFASDPSASFCLSVDGISRTQNGGWWGTNVDCGRRIPPRSSHLERRFQEIEGAAPGKQRRAGQNRTDR